MTQSAAALEFIGENTLVAGGEEGEVYYWDLLQRSCSKRFWDENSISVTALSASRSHVAVGSSTGVVNLYELQSSVEAPVKTFFNLTTAITGLTFNHTGELLVGWSKWKRDGVKLFHVAAGTAYSNWPSLKDHLKFPFVTQFNEDSSLLGIGNDEGHALLYRLSHFAH